MGSLCRGHSLTHIYKNVVVPLSLFGFGSVSELLNMKIHELLSLKDIMNDEDTINTRRILHYVPKQ